MKHWAIGNAFLCLIAISLLAQPYHCSARNQPRGAADAHSGVSENQQSRANTDVPSASPSKWYAVLKRSDWWLVIIAALTGLAIVYQAREMKRATAAMRDGIPLQKQAAEAASLNALAAKQAVELVISKERCRIEVQPWGPLRLPWHTDPVNEQPIFEVSDQQGVSYKVLFYGLTEGYILEANASACVSESEDPPKAFASPMRGIPTRVPVDVADRAGVALLLPRFKSLSDVIDVLEGKKFVHFWGCINYRDVFYDVFRQERRTAFRWVWKFTGLASDTPIGTPLGGRLGGWYKCGPPEDNQET